MAASAAAARRSSSTSSRWRSNAADAQTIGRLAIAKAPSAMTCEGEVTASENSGGKTSSQMRKAPTAAVSRPALQPKNKAETMKVGNRVMKSKPWRKSRVRIRSPMAPTEAPTATG